MEKFQSEKDNNLNNKRYRQNAVRPIQKKHIMEIADKLDLDLNDEEVNEYESLSKGVLETWNFTYFYKTTLDKSAFLRSTIETYTDIDNALYYKCLVKGKENGIMSGLRIIVKDTVFIAGLPLMNGSHMLEGFAPVEDATIIKRLLSNGADIVGKSNNEDLCFSGSSITCVKGPVENGLLKNCNSGGSSSGSATAVAKGLCDIAIAGDQGGSIRIPAAYNGLIGFKPTFGLIPYTGVLGIEYTLDHVGPIAKTIKDIALFMDCVAGPDEHDQRYYKYLRNTQFNADSFLFPESEEESTSEIKSLKKKSEWERSLYYGISSVKLGFSKAVENSKELLKDLKVAFIKEGVNNVFPELKDLRSKSLGLLSSLMQEKFSLSIDEVSIPQHDLGTALTTLYFIEGFFDLFKNDFVCKNNFNKENYEAAKSFFDGKKSIKDLSHTNKLFLVLGEYIKKHYGSRFYAKAQDIRKELTDGYLEVFRHYDLLLLPTVPGLPQELPKNDLNIKDYFNLCLNSVIPNTSVYNLTGFPALTINFNKMEKICPVMVVGRHFEDHRVLQFAKLIEELLIEK